MVCRATWNLPVVEDARTHATFYPLQVCCRRREELLTTLARLLVRGAKARHHHRHVIFEQQVFTPWSTPAPLVLANMSEQLGTRHLALLLYFLYL